MSVDWLSHLYHFFHRRSGTIPLLPNALSEGQVLSAVLGARLAPSLPGRGDSRRGPPRGWAPHWLSTAVVTSTAKSDLRRLRFYSSAEACLTQASPGNFKGLAGLSSFPESLREHLFLFHF